MIDGQGATGPSATEIKAPAVLNNVSNANGSNYQPIIYAFGAGKTVNITDMYVNGDGGRTIPNYFGIYYFEAGGTISGNRVAAIRDATYSGNQSGNAIYVNHTWDVNFAHTVNITNNTVLDYQKTGILINEMNTQAIITGNTVTGQNIAGVNATVWYPIGYGAHATITGNTITNNIWNSANPHVYMASGILIAGAGTTDTGTPTGGKYYRYTAATHLQATKRVSLLTALVVLLTELTLTFLTAVILMRTTRCMQC